MSFRQKTGAALLFAAASGLAASEASAAEQQLKLERVLLTTGGVGYFEHEARVEGNAELQLDVRLDQVSDVLKSIIVFDEKGTVGEVTLPSREPLREVFRDLPFSQNDLVSQVSLLRALQGAEIEVATAGKVITGRLVAVTEETITLSEYRTEKRHRLTVLTATGMRQAILEETASIRFVDRVLQGQVERALAAIAGLGERERRTLKVDIKGQGERLVRVGYIVEVPLWKATYRLELRKAAEKAQLQGWAMLENMSGMDWKNINLTVVAGNPVTFRQALYDTYFVTRPEVPVEVLGRILPRMDVGAISPAPAPAPARALRRSAVHSYGGAGFSAFAAESEDEEYSRPPIPPAALQPPVPKETMTQVVFHFDKPVNLERGKSLLLPIVSGPISSERVSIYQPDIEPRHPLASIRLTNDTGAGLPPGALTIYERPAEGGGLEYVGDAQMGALPVDQERFLSFAVDLKVKIDREVRSDRVILGGSIVDGVMHVVRGLQQETVYKIAGATGENRVVVLEVPRMEGYQLLKPKDKLIGTTPTHFRIRQEVPAGENPTVTVVLERPIEETAALVAMPPDDIRILLNAPTITGPIHDALVRIQELRKDITDREIALGTLEKERATIVADQERLRKNLEAVTEGSDLHQRYLAKLNQQEDRLEVLVGEIEKAREAVETAKKALAEYVRGLRLERSPS